MAQSNDTNGSGITNAGVGSGGGSAVSGAGTGEKKSPRLMDVKKYLEKNKSKYGKSIGDLMAVLFKDQLFSEAEWTQKVKAAVERRVK